MPTYGGLRDAGGYQGFASFGPLEALQTANRFNAKWYEASPIYTSLTFSFVVSATKSTATDETVIDINFTKTWNVRRSLESLMNTSYGAGGGTDQCDWFSYPDLLLGDNEFIAYHGDNDLILKPAAATPRRIRLASIPCAVLQDEKLGGRSLHLWAHPP